MVCALQDAGHSPIVFDNLSRGHADAVQGAALVIGDLRSVADLDACFAAHRIDLVMHFAALTYVGESVAEPEKYYENNVVGGLNLLSAMRRHGVGRIVFSSTCAVYGEPERLPIVESHPQRPINPYGRTKQAIEQALADYGTAYGLRSIALRYFNAAGADPQGRVGERHDPETHLIPLVLEEAMRLRGGGDPSLSRLSVYGSDYPTPDGSCVRDYVHVSDICRAHLLAAEWLLGESASGFLSFNLANGTGFSVLEVIETCREVSGQPVQFSVKPRRPGDSAILVGNADNAAELLGWKPKFTELRDIVGTAWNWMVRRQSSVPGS
jgi:UDP-glucose-4-epimerase GalE